MQESELGLATRAAWLSYVGGLTQEQIATRLHVSRVKVARLVAAAQRAGRVQVFVDGPVVECLELEEAVRRRFGLGSCVVAPDAEELGLPLRALGAAGAHYLHRRLEQDGAATIGVGHGRTLAAVVGGLPRQPRPGLRFVSLLGSLTRKSAAHPFDVIHRLTEITGAEGYFLPAPFFADSLEDKQVLLAQKSIQHVMSLTEAARLHVVGVGEVAPDAQLLTSGMIRPDELRALQRAGAVGEVLGQFYDAEGCLVAAEINRRAVAVPLGALRGKEVVAIAGGPEKVEAIAAVLAAGVITSLITDETTARRLVDQPRAAASPAIVPTIANVA